MIRSRHEIDTKLINFFISDKIFDDEINESLINWHASLEDKEHQKTRNNAIKFLEKLSFEVLSEIDYPIKERNELIKIFEPLELLLRTALSLKDSKGKSSNVRDHLSHTVRNVLFTNYILKKYQAENNSTIRKQLFIAAIFHDIAYPIEKLKKVTDKLGEATINLLNSKGSVSITLNNPDDLLELLDFIGGTIIDKLKTKRNELNKRKNKEDGKEEIKALGFTINKIKHIYRDIICKAIAGEGLFETSHSFSSVVLLLRPIVKYWRNSEAYLEMNLDALSNICLAMTYHDRDNSVFSMKGFDIPLILRVMRISDELQEWDRERNSYTTDVTILDDPSTVLSLKIEMRDKSKLDLCKPALVIPHKIKGLLPVVYSETLKIVFEFPNEIKISDLKVEIEKEKIDIDSCKFMGSERTKQVELIFSNQKVTIDLKQ